MRYGMPEKLQKPVAVLMASFMISFSIMPIPVSFADGEQGEYTQNGEVYTPTLKYDPTAPPPEEEAPVGDNIEANLPLSPLSPPTEDAESGIWRIESDEKGITSINLSIEEAISNDGSVVEEVYGSYFGKTGMWEKVDSENGDVTKRYSMKLTEKDSTGVLTGSVFYANGLDEQFNATETSKFSKKITTMNTVSFGKTGDWEQWYTDLDNTFAVTVSTKYSKRLEEKDASGVLTGAVFYANGLNEELYSTATSEFSKKFIGMSTVHFGETGNWERWHTKLSNTFSVTAATEYFMRLEEKDDSGKGTGSIFYALNLNPDFTPSEAVDLIKVQKASSENESEVYRRIEEAVIRNMEARGQSTENIQIQIHLEKGAIDAGFYLTIAASVDYGVEVKTADGKSFVGTVSAYDYYDYASMGYVKDYQVNNMLVTNLPYESVKAIANWLGVGIKNITNIDEGVGVDLATPMGNASGLLVGVTYNRPNYYYWWGLYGDTTEHAVAVMEDKKDVTKRGTIIYEPIAMIDAPENITATAVKTIVESLRQAYPDQMINYADIALIEFTPVNTLVPEPGIMWRGNIKVTRINNQTGEYAADEGIIARLENPKQEEYQVSFKEEDTRATRLKNAMVEKLAELTGLQRVEIEGLIADFELNGNDLIMHLNSAYAKMSDYMRLLNPGGDDSLPVKLVAHFTQIGSTDAIPPTPIFSIESADLIWQGKNAKILYSPQDGRLQKVSWDFNGQQPNYVDKYLYDAGGFTEVHRSFAEGQNVVFYLNPGQNLLHHIVESGANGPIRTDLNYEVMISACADVEGAICAGPFYYLTGMHRTDEKGNTTSDIQLTNWGWGWGSFAPLNLALVRFPDGRTQKIYFESINDLLAQVGEIELRAYDPLALAALNHLSRALGIDAEKLKGLVDVEVDEDNKVYFTFRNTDQPTGSGQMVGALLFDKVPQRVEYTMALINGENPEGGFYVPEKASFIWDGMNVSDVEYFDGEPRHIATFLNGSPLSRDIITLEIHKGGEKSGKVFRIARYFGEEDPSAPPDWSIRISDDFIQQVIVYGEEGSIAHTIDFEYITEAFNCVMAPCEGEGKVVRLNALVIRGAKEDLVRAVFHLDDPSQADITISGWNGTTTLRYGNLENLINEMLRRVDIGPKLLEIDRQIKEREESIEQLTASLPHLIESLRTGYLAQHAEMGLIEEQLDTIIAFLKEAMEKVSESTGEEITNYLSYVEPSMDIFSQVRESLLTADPTQDMHYRYTVMIIESHERYLAALQLAREQILLGNEYFFPPFEYIPHIIVENWWAWVKHDFEQFVVIGDGIVENARKDIARAELTALIDPVLAEAKRQAEEQDEYNRNQLEKDIAEKIAKSLKTFDDGKNQLDSLKNRINELLVGLPAGNSLVIEVREFLASLDPQMKDLGVKLDEYHEFLRSSMRTEANIKLDELRLWQEKLSVAVRTIIEAETLEALLEIKERLDSPNNDNPLQPVQLPRPAGPAIIDPVGDVKVLIEKAGMYVAKLSQIATQSPQAIVNLGPRASSSVSSLPTGSTDSSDEERRKKQIQKWRMKLLGLV